METGADREYEVFQGVTILDVQEQGSEIVVDIYGGDGSVCGSVTYDVSDPALRRRRTRVLRRWCTDGTSLTYVRHQDSVALMDEVALFAASMEE